MASGAHQESADWEKPQAGVAVSAFALGQREVTRGEFAAFIKATGWAVEPGCVQATGNWEEDPARNWQNPGFAQTDDHPVVCVSAHDADVYAKWLVVSTGKAYRLASEAEWEMAARAGTRTRRYWGDDADDMLTCRYANTADKDQAEKLNVSGTVPCRDGSLFTAAVGTKEPNALGLRDMLGNVSEWVKDCFSPTYEGMPMDGKARSGCSDSRRVIRGGSWNFGPGILRAAVRGRNAPDFRGNHIGFRIARTL